MNNDKKRIQSIVPSIGLFLIFHALFYRQTFTGLVAEDSWLNQYVEFARSVSFYLYIFAGIGLCRYKKFAYYLTYATTFLIGFGLIFSLHPGREISAKRLIPEVLAHVILCGLLYFVQRKIRHQNQLEEAKRKEKEKA